MGPLKTSRATPKVLIIGGSYGGLAAALNLADLCNGKADRSGLPGSISEPKPATVSPVDITIVDERDGFYHLIGSSLALASSNYASKAWTKFDEIPALQSSNIRHQQGRVKKIDCETEVATITHSLTGKDFETLYDYISLNKNDYLLEANGHVEAINKAEGSIVVIGGGAVGIEMAAELKLTEPTKTVKLIHSRDKLLSHEPLPDELKAKSLELLQEAGVEVILGHRVTKIADISSEKSALYILTLSDGTQMEASHVISAISNGVPSSSFLPQSALEQDSFVKINSSLNIQSIPNSPNHFAIGDVASWSGIKRCGSALYMGNMAAKNIHEQILREESGGNYEPEFGAFPEVPPMIIMAIGSQAVSYGPEGMKYGKELMNLAFGVDLWLQTCWDCLRLGESGEPKSVTLKE